MQIRTLGCMIDEDLASFKTHIEISGSSECCFARSLFSVNSTIITAHKRSLRRLCFCTCLPFCPGGGEWYPSMPCRWYPSIPCRSPGPHPGGKLRDLAWGCLQAHTSGGIPACTEAEPPQLTATAAGGTHPTGMHSCILKFGILE